ncbi:MAG TPA: hypothetical protein VFD64_11565 [Gemmatimonadaceae bacterium]|jgi:hypothetical protein|nr:hypothetical protein [Gemmatimonadaceae bacterium]
MRSLRHFLFLVAWLVTAGACATGKVKPDLNDVTPPEITLDVTAVDPEDQTAKSATAPPGTSKNLAATENTDIIIVATAKDAGGIKALRIWNVGANLKDMAKGEVLGTSSAAFKNVTAQATMVAVPGFKLGVFAEAENFGSGGPSQTTVTSGVVVLPVSGIAQPAGGTGKTTLTFSWDAAAKAYVAAGLPSPGSGAKIVGIDMSNPFGAGHFVSLYRGAGNINSLDLRTDFVRVWQNESANFFNGNWSSQPWYLLKGKYHTQGAFFDPIVEVRWEKP